MNQLLDRWLEVLDVEASTRIGYERKIKKHIRPLLGKMQVARVNAELLETFYARLRKCRDRCDGRRYIQHRTARGHECDARLAPGWSVRHRRPTPARARCQRCVTSVVARMATPYR